MTSEYLKIEDFEIFSTLDNTLQGNLRFPFFTTTKYEGNGGGFRDGWKSGNTLCKIATVVYHKNIV